MATKKERLEPLARNLFLKVNLDGKGIVEWFRQSGTSITEATISKWRSAGKWDEIKKANSVTRDSVLSRVMAKADKLLDQDELDAKETDQLVKYSAIIDRLERKLNITSAVEVYDAFQTFLSKRDLQLAKDIIPHFHEFLLTLGND
ncbi:MAG: hypothetical protein ABJG41_10010 [Cyclobacteriaceae bacterium]